MQTNSNAFEGWILALKTLAVPESGCTYSVTFKPNPEPNNRHYQRFIFRLNSFNNLFGDQWFVLDDEIKDIIKRECLYSKYIDKKRLLCNSGLRGRNNKSNFDGKDSESEWEWKLCKSGPDSCFLPEKFNSTFGNELNDHQFAL